MNILKSQKRPAIERRTFATVGLVKSSVKRGEDIPGGVADNFEDFKFVHEQTAESDERWKKDVWDRLDELWPVEARTSTAKNSQEEKSDACTKN